jgi:arylsulfatase
MGDDIAWMQVGVYHHGIGVGETPNIDRLAHEGGMFTTYYAMQSCTSGRNAFITGMYPLRTGMIPPQLPGSPSYLRPGTPMISKFLLIWFETLKAFPPIQSPASYNLTQVMEQIKASNGQPSE